MAIATEVILGALVIWGTIAPMIAYAGGHAVGFRAGVEDDVQFLLRLEEFRHKVLSHE